MYVKHSRLLIDIHTEQFKHTWLLVLTKPMTYKELINA